MPPTMLRQGSCSYFISFDQIANHGHERTQWMGRIVAHDVKIIVDNRSNAIPVPARIEDREAS
jgi:hypothetical protein